jgi:hypothetical protein
VLLFVYAVLGPVKQARTAGGRGRAAAQPAE